MYIIVWGERIGAAFTGVLEEFDDTMLWWYGLLSTSTRFVMFVGDTAYQINTEDIRHGREHTPEVASISFLLTRSLRLKEYSRFVNQQALTRTS